MAIVVGIVIYMDLRGFIKQVGEPCEPRGRNRR
jgi:hypothetical protein